MPEKKIAYAYTVTVYENDDVEVNPLEVEGGKILTNPEIMKDIKDTAEKIKLQEIQNAAYVGTIKAFSAMESAGENVEAEAAPTVEK